MSDVVLATVAAVRLRIFAEVKLPDGRGQQLVTVECSATGSTVDRAVRKATEEAVGEWTAAAVLAAAASVNGSGEKLFFADDEPWLEDDTDSADRWTGALIDSVGHTWIMIEGSSYWVVLDRRREVREYHELSFPVTIAPIQWMMN